MVEETNHSMSEIPNTIIRSGERKSLAQETDGRNRIKDTDKLDIHIRAEVIFELTTLAKSTMRYLGGV
jgi:hypothetical protein